MKAKSLSTIVMIVALGLVTLPALSRAASVVAVLDIEPEDGGGLDASVLRLLADEARGAVLQAIPGSLVITRENMADILQELGTSVEECLAEAECKVGIFRNMNAEIGLTGSVTKLGNEYLIA